MKVLFHPITGEPLARSGRHPDGDVVLYCIHRRRTQYARRYVRPLDPCTASQQQMRAIMRAVAPAWRTRLTPEQRRAWNARALGVPSRWRAGQGPLSGQQLFVKLNCVWLRIGRKELLLWPPRRAKFYRSPVESLEVSWSGGRPRVALTVAGPLRRDLMILGAAPCSAGWSKLRHPVYLGLIAAGARGRCFDITEWYVRRFGEPEVGEQVFIRVRQHRNGWESAPRDVSALVPAQPTIPATSVPAAHPPRVPFPAPLRETALWPLFAPEPLRPEAPVLPACSGAVEPCTRGRSHPAAIASRLGHSALRPVRSAPSCLQPGQRRKAHCRERWRGG